MIDPTTVELPHVHVNDKCATELIKALDDLLVKFNKDFSGPELITILGIFLAGHLYRSDTAYGLETMNRESMKALFDDVYNDASRGIELINAHVMTAPGAEATVN